MEAVIKRERSSGIELLKIISILIIVLSHVTQTLCAYNPSASYQDYVILYGYASKDLQVIILNIFGQGGGLGNNIFFICSAWFLTGRIKSERKKAFDLLCTVWTISVIYLIVYFAVAPDYLTKDNLKELMPTTFIRNWYMTAYIIFLFIYPLFNKFIASINQKQHLRIVLFSSFLWIVMDYINHDLFFPSTILTWCSVYFLIAYLKLYCNETLNNIKVGCTLLIIGIVGYISQVVVTNYVGLYIFESYSDEVLRWASNCSPFNIMISLGAIIICSKIKFKSKFINYVSGLSMFVYLIHENKLFRTFTRPYIWHQIYVNIGFHHIVLLDLLYALSLFIVAALISAVYKETFQKLVKKVSGRLYGLISSLYHSLEARLITIK